MTISDAKRMLTPLDKLGDLEYQNFGEACRDPRAAILAVNDFDSFKRVFSERSARKTREDRLLRLYGLYLALSKTKLNISRKSIDSFKATVSGYERVSLHYFVKDIKLLVSVGVAILSTPILDAIQSAETSKRALIALQKRATGDAALPKCTDSLIGCMLKSRIRI